MIRRGLTYFLLRLLVILIAVIVYLALLPVEVSFAGGLSVRFPPFVRLRGDTLAYPDPINWNYILLIPVALVILIVGYELIRLLYRRR